jgi:hypothetical protein
MMKRIGLLTFDEGSNIRRGMQTLPDNLMLNYNSDDTKYEKFLINKLDCSLTDITINNNLVGYLSFPRNTSTIMEFISPLEANKNNVIFADTIAET